MESSGANILLLNIRWTLFITHPVYMVTINGIIRCEYTAPKYKMDKQCIYVDKRYNWILPHRIKQWHKLTDEIYASVAKQKLYSYKIVCLVQYYINCISRRKAGIGERDILSRRGGPAENKF